jgi:hypothetical protein
MTNHHCDGSTISLVSSTTNKRFGNSFNMGNKHRLRKKYAIVPTTKKTNPENPDYEYDYGYKQEETTEPRRRNLTIVIPRQKKKIPPTPYSLLTQSKLFQDMVHNAFDLVDQDGRGFVDEKELYAGLLLIHLKLGMVVGPAACRTISRERCKAVFEKFDVEERGYLNREEFGKVMVFVFSNVLCRLVVQWSMTIVIVPLAAQEILDWANWLNSNVNYTATVLEDRVWPVSWCRRLLMWFFWKLVVMLPERLLGFVDASNDLVQAIPDRIWNALPLTLLSTLLGIFVVPFLFFKLDTITQWFAEGRDTKIL